MSDNNEITAVITTEEPAVAATLDDLRYLVLHGKAGKAPRVSTTTGNWEVYDNDIQGWVDTGISASTDITPEQLAEAIEDYFDEHPIDVPTDVVLYTAQSLTPAQQEQARENIKAFGSDAGEEIRNAFETRQAAGSSNLLNPAEAIDGYYITNTNDTPQANASYWYSGYIPVEVGKTYTFQRGNRNLPDRAIASPRWTAAYDANKTLLSAKGGTYLNSYTVPDGVAFVRISTGNYSPKDHYTTYVEGTTLLDYEAYEAPSAGLGELKRDYYDVDYIRSLIDTESDPIPRGIVSRFDLAAGETHVIEQFMQDMDNYSMVFRGDVDNSFEGVIVSHGYNLIYGGYVKVTPTVFEYYMGTESSPRISVAHGLTLKDYISIVVKAESNIKMTVTVSTNGGKFERSGLAWDVRRGYLRAHSVGATAMPNCILAYWANGWSAETQLYGDSYFGPYADKWTKYLRDSGNTDCLLNGYPGRTAQDAITVALNVLAHSQPKRVIWCLGMNNGDTGETVNAAWKAAVDELVSVCDTRGIELILSTIPNVATVDNTYKNDYVRASGRRYIDFASAVGAENDTTWYDGMLSSDGVHPAVPGALALYRQAISDVPELLKNADVPTKVSQLTNDSGYQTAQQVQTAIAAIPAVRYDAAQTLSDAQKEQARLNIDAGTYSKPSSGIPASDLASAVQTSLGKADTALQQHQSLAGYATETYVQQQIAAIPDELPAVAASDNGKFLRVVSGAWAAETIQTYQGGSY